MNDMSGCPKGIAGSGLPSEPAPSSHCHAGGGRLRSSPDAGERATLRRHPDELSVALDPESVTGDDALSPCWNARRAEMQSMW